MSSDISGQVALVTGASGDLGRGIALCLARAGATVVVNYRGNQQGAEKTREVIQAGGGTCELARGDVSDPGQVEEMFARLDRDFGGVQILCNNAGIQKDQDLFSTSLEDWDLVMRTNLTSCFLCCKAAMTRMAKAKYGRVVNISSIAGQRGALYGNVHYAASKAGMFGLTKTLARTGAPLGINVNCVAPGPIEGSLLLSSHGEDVVRKLNADIPLGLGKPQDVGLAVAYLCGPGGGYITGSTIDLNGGMYLR
jgi:3-oxoacyl-[acyl-carrier protein] reductase